MFFTLQFFQCQIWQSKACFNIQRKTKELERNQNAAPKRLPRSTVLRMRLFHEGLAPSIRYARSCCSGWGQQTPKSASYFYSMGSLKKRKIKKIKSAVKSKKRDIQFESEGYKLPWVFYLHGQRLCLSGWFTDFIWAAICTQWSAVPECALTHYHLLHDWSG